VLPHNHRGSVDRSLLGVAFWPHRDHAFAVDTQTNVLIARPFLIAAQFFIGWPAWCQDAHTAHSRIGRNEATGGTDQPFYIVVACVLRGQLHFAHAFQRLRAARSSG
jgi:hypothetical protein